MVIVLFVKAGCYHALLNIERQETEKKKVTGLIINQFASVKARKVQL